MDGTEDMKRGKSD